MTLLAAIADAPVAFRIRKRSESAGYGDYFDLGDSQFAAARPDAVPLAKDGEDDRLYSRTVGAMEDYTGTVEVFYYQDDELEQERVVGSELVELKEGVPIPAAGSSVVLPSPDSDLSLIEIASQRTWHLHPCSTGATATNVISVAQGSAEWLAIDFLEVLDKSDSIDSVQSVVDLQAKLAVDEQKVSGNRREVHMKLSGFSAGDESTIKVVINTAQGQRVVGQGVITTE